MQSSLIKLITLLCINLNKTTSFILNLLKFFYLSNIHKVKNKLLALDLSLKDITVKPLVQSPPLSSPPL